MDFVKKKAELLQAQEQLKAQMNYVVGQLALCDEALAPEKENPKKEK